MEYPNPGATPTKFSLNERTQYVSTSVGKVKIGSKNLQDCIHYDSAPGLIKVITVCNDAQGNFEGATTYFIQRVSVRNTEDITSADRQGDGASQDAASQQDTQNQQDSLLGKTAVSLRLLKMVKFQDNPLKKLRKRVW